MSDNTPTDAAPAHAKYFTASGSAMWLNCPASVALQDGLTDQETEYAAEGTAAHELASTALEEGKAAHAYIGRLFHGYTVTDDMANDVQVYVDAINRAYGKYSTAEVLYEQRVQYGPLIGIPAADDDDGFGTGDAIILAPSSGNNPSMPSTIEIHDLKFGRGVQVYAERNSQMMLYALGSLHEHSLVEEYDRIVMCIHQPRKDHYDEWECTRHELLAFADEAKAKVSEAKEILLKKQTGELTAEAVGALAVPGEKQCRWCKAKPHCPALASKVYAEVFDEFEDESALTAEDVVIETQDPKLLNQRMNHIELIESWCKAVRSEVEKLLLQGVDFADWKLVQGRKGARQWMDAEIAIKAMRKFKYKVSELYTKNPLTPAQAEKLIGSKKEQWNRMRTLVTQSEGNLSVAPMNDKRPAAKAIEDDDFGDETGQDLV